MVEYVLQALKQASYEASVLLYSPEINPFLEDLTKLADREFYFDESPRDSLRLTARLGKR